MVQKPRRLLALVTLLGTTQIHLRNPLIVAWWSAAFPGFGYLLLAKYSRGFMLIGWEMFINSKMHLNEAMVYTFLFQFERAGEVLDIGWMSLYAPVYLFSIYDTYRTSVDINHHYILAKRENAPIANLKLGAMEINYIDKRSPWVSIAWSLLMPGMGQLYTHRILNAFFVLTSWIVLSYYSHLLLGIQCMLMGDWAHAASVVEMKWLMFLPSIYGFAVYDAYVSTVEYNKLFDHEQIRWLESGYQPSRFPFPKSPLLK